MKKAILITIIIAVFILLTGVIYSSFFELINKSAEKIWQTRKSADTETINLVTYRNSKLGFSIKIPDKISFDYINNPNACPDLKHPLFVNTKIFEDNTNGVVYILPEYFYNNLNDKVCEKIIANLETIKDGRYYYAEVSAIYIKNVKNDAELNQFVKDRLSWASNGTHGCFAGEKKAWKNQNGVYEVALGGVILDDKSEPGPDNFSCVTMSDYYLLYYPEKQKVMTINFGQASPFGDTQDMIDSFRFE